VDVGVDRPEIRLVVVIGPIASGKSTVCAHLTDRLLAAGRTVVSSDLDDVAAMIHVPGGRTAEHWEQAHRVHGSLIRGWLTTSADLVIAHGPIYTGSETDALMGDVLPRTGVLRVLLLASLQSARQRVAGNPDRELSKDPSFLRAAYERFWSIFPDIDSCDLTFDTDRTSAELIASRIVDRLLEGSGICGRRSGASGAVGSDSAHVSNCPERFVRSGSPVDSRGGEATGAGADPCLHNHRRE
jgi:hypothetical protein